MTLQRLDNLRPDDRLSPTSNPTRDVDRCAPLFVFDRDPGAALDQRRDDALARLTGRDMQRRLAVAVDGIDVDALFDTESNRRDLVGVGDGE